MRTSIRASTERRHAPRLKTFQPALMKQTGGYGRVHILNLSVSGALVYAPAAPASGSEVRLACGDFLRGARVAWRRGRCVGLEFDRPVCPRALDDLIRVREELVRQECDGILSRHGAAAEHFLVAGRPAVGAAQPSQS